jgi:Sulfatase-modifying factor enzyme 1
MKHVLLSVWALTVLACSGAPVTCESSCDGCCDAQGICREASTLSCGKGGSACIVCSPIQECVSALCVLPTASGGGGGASGGGAGGGGGGASMDAGDVDGGEMDAGADDAGTTDAGTTDAGMTDAGMTDAGTTDAGTVDAGTADAGTVDAGTVDAGTVDAGTVDAGTADAGTADAGTVDAGTVDAGVDAGVQCLAGSTVCGARCCGCGTDMVAFSFNGQSLCIDAFEVSQASSGLAQSVVGVQPTVNVTPAQAIAACAAIGKRLCSEAEWQAACQGPSVTIYPYGNTYSGSACNGLDRGYGAIGNTGTTPGCQGGYSGLWDMSGNVYEFTSTCANGTCRVKSGSFRSSASAGLLRCDRGFDFNDSAGDPAVGFRCCRNAN